MRNPDNMNTNKYDCEYEYDYEYERRLRDYVTMYQRQM